MATINKGTLFPPAVVNQLINKTKGASALAALSAQEPVSFDGNEYLTFALDGDIDVVGEGGQKTAGGATIAPVVAKPFKVEYSARVSAEFMIADDERKLELLQAFIAGYAKKLAVGLDKIALHAINPRTGQASTVIGNDKAFDDVVADTNVVEQAATPTPDEDVESAIEKLGENTATGMIMSPAFRTQLAGLRNGDGGRLYPDLAWGNKPGVINGLSAQVTSAAAPKMAYIGDFENAFKWGIAHEIPVKILEAGDPDGSGRDLGQYNEVLLRAETWLAFGILDPTAFAIIAPNT